MIVTADGNHVISNAYRNKDLFWALRGGGGGTWGVVTSVTYKTHPSTPFSAALFTVNSTNSDSTQRLFAEVIRLTPSLVDQGYGGYGGGSSEGIQFVFLSPNATAEQTNATFLPLFEFARSQPGITIFNTTTLFTTFLEFFDTFFSTDGQVGAPSELSSWLLPKDVVATDKPEELARELLRTAEFGYL
jgi:FAD/FMN-containing dehydrogenase